MGSRRLRGRAINAYASAGRDVFLAEPTCMHVPWDAGRCECKFLVLYRRRPPTHLGGLAGAGLTDNDDDLVLADDLQQLLAAVVHRQEAPLLRDRLRAREVAGRLRWMHTRGGTSCTLPQSITVVPVSTHVTSAG